jgi:signal transduction histidine kinase
MHALSVPARLAPAWRRHVLVGLTLAVGTAFSVLLALMFWGRERDRAEPEFARRADEVAQSLENQLRTDIDVLQSIRGLYMASAYVSRDEFASFVEHAVASHDDVLALAWIPQVPSALRGQYEAAATEDGLRRFSFKPVATATSGHGMLLKPAQAHAGGAASPVGWHLPLYYVEPEHAMDGYLGLDLASHAPLSRALDSARDSGAAVAGPVVAVQIGGQELLSLPVFVPIYKGGYVPDAAAARRDALSGFAAEFIRLDTAMGAAVTPGIAARLYEGRATPADAVGGRRLPVGAGYQPALSEDLPLMSLIRQPQDQIRPDQRLLAATISAPSENTSSYISAVREIDVAGQRWTVLLEPSTRLLAGYVSGQPWVALAVGMLFTLLLTTYMFTALGRTARIERLVRDLAEANAGLEQEVAERRRAQEALVEQARDLERSNQELEQFAYVASHDLQEPLRMVSSFTQLLSKRYSGQLDSDADEFIAYAVDGASRMQGLINDLLAYSRVGTRGREPEPTHAGSVLSAVIDNLQTCIEEAQAEVTWDELPTVLADATQLGQVFQNLISNAIKFRADEPPRIHVSVQLDEDGRPASRWTGRPAGSAQTGPVGTGYQPALWTFSVRDNGIGIEQRHLERIFVMFQRLNGKAEYEGNGIGLAVCKKIVERHGGQIWVESEPGMGSTFYFTLAAVNVSPNGSVDVTETESEPELRSQNSHVQRLEGAAVS